VRFAHEVHPSEIAYDYWTTVRTLEAIGHRPAFGLNWDPSHFVLAGPRPGRLPVGLQGPDLPRRLQGREAQVGNGRNGRMGRTCAGPTLGAAGTSSPRDTATCRGRRASGCSTPIGYDGPISIEWEDAGMDRPGRRARGAGVRPAAGLRPAQRELRRRLLLRRLRPPL
jgi:hypothetical protein